MGTATGSGASNTSRISQAAAAFALLFASACSEPQTAAAPESPAAEALRRAQSAGAAPAVAP